MAEKDISAKVLMYHNDVFSDVFDSLLFRKPYIDEKNLRDVIPGAAYQDFHGGLRIMERDLLKEYGEGKGANYFAIAEFGIGNQAVVDPTIPVRVMGYDYAVYKRQLDEYNNKKRDLNRLLKAAQSIGNDEIIRSVQIDIDGLGEFKLTPVITIILNFSRTRWSKAKSLKELISAGYPEIAEHMQDYQVHVFDVLYLDDETKKRFTSDFRDVVTVLSEGAIDKRHDFRRLKYPVDTLDMLYAYTKDKHYLDIRNQIVRKERKGEPINMGDFFDQVERNKIIETARKMYEGNRNELYAVYAIQCGLDVSEDEARRIFETEILQLA